MNTDLTDEEGGSQGASQIHTWEISRTDSSSPALKSVTPPAHVLCLSSPKTREACWSTPINEEAEGRAFALSFIHASVLPE